MHSIKCPECDYDMGVRATKVTHSSGGQAYDWTHYWCKRHDIHIQLEVPQTEDE